MGGLNVCKQLSSYMNRDPSHIQMQFQMCGPQWIDVSSFTNEYVHATIRR